MSLVTAPFDAVRYVCEYARNLNTKELQVFGHILEMSNIDEQLVGQFFAKIQQSAQIAAHFHPDRVTANGLMVVESMQHSGRYLNQFESFVSNGKLDPQQEGERAQWENHLFGDAFTNAPLNQRPKYGALDIAKHMDGPCPRFGSCYFVFKTEVSQRASLCFGDSYQTPETRGTVNVFKPILAATLLECFERDAVLGLANLRPKQFMESYIWGDLAKLGEDIESRLSQPKARNLDHYVEAQIHGDICLSHDVESLIADDSFYGTDIGAALVHLAQLYDINLLWRPAYQLAVDSVPDDFRGSSMVNLAKQVAINEEINAYVIGQEAKRVAVNQVGLSPAEVQAELQQLKLLWHVLVKFG
ncbi:hypothetical protein RJ45_07075 [Photobacterium gaetbulicola]|uniref:DUF3626 domain-containing protein n=1 Tax=Photobacterium gaetbulicola TaxID=1295392 RepID=A0A0B9H014_9GAMM|nr:DUF3626 domain-containing protein [Photobacterium gaetbulicola]KHT64291.1 hypothetical protein RJ45_07075 [Photobacterium gaetbulicola]